MVRERIRYQPEALKPRPRPHPKDPTILDALAAPELFKPFFKDVETWAVWFAIIAAIFALPMTDEQLRHYRHVTGRTEPPTEIAKQVYLVIGRRGGKSRILALIAVWLACFFEYREFLAPGEKGVVQVIAADRKQARVVLRYVKALLSRVPMLARMIAGETKESIELTNDIVIEVATASFRSVRGFTVVAALLDEIAFFPQEESANPDVEILNAIKPSMATIPNALLLAASSPYARRGVLYDTHKKHFGQDGDPILVVQADTATTNPVIDPQIIADAYEADPASASAEYGAQFRADIESFVSVEVVDACVARGVLERPPKAGLRYFAFSDPSGGSNDSFTLAIAHRDADSLILDCIREVKPPFSPQSVCEEFADVLKTYGLTKVIGDRYAGLWPVEQFAKAGIKYEQSARPKSDLYRDLLPLLNSRRCELLDHRRLVTQLTSLERRTARGGRDSIDHPPAGRDDIANAVAGVLTAIAAPKPRLRYGTIGTPNAAGVHQFNELDPKTGRPLAPDPYRNPLSPEHNGCIPGKGPDAELSLFNAQLNIMQPMRRLR